MLLRSHCSDSLQVDVVAEVVLIEERAARPKKLLQANILDLFHKKAKTSGPATQDLRSNIDGRDALVREEEKTVENFNAVGREEEGDAERDYAIDQMDVCSDQDDVPVVPEPVDPALLQAMTREKNLKALREDKINRWLFKHAWATWPDKARSENKKKPIIVCKTCNEFAPRMPGQKLNAFIEGSAISTYSDLTSHENSAIHKRASDKKIGKQQVLEINVSHD